MGDQARIERIATHIFEAHRRKERFQRLRGALAPTSLEEAYLVQDAVHRRFAAAGWGSSAATRSPSPRPRYRSFAGSISRPAARSSRAPSSARPRPSGWPTSCISASSSSWLCASAATSRPRARPTRADSVAPAVAACMPAFELIEDRGADYGDLDAASILTDKCWCGGVVLGPEVADWRRLDLAAAPVELRWNGDVVDRGLTGAVMGHPFEALAWLANLLASRGRGMRAGEIVITGSALRTRFPEAGDEITYRIAGLGEASLRILSEPA